MARMTPGWAEHGRFRVVYIPDPDAFAEVGGVIDGDVARRDLLSGNFEPGTVLRIRGINLVVHGTPGKRQRLIFETKEERIKRCPRQGLSTVTTPGTR